MKDQEGAGGPSAWTPPLPPLARTTEGHPRRVGVEVELFGLDGPGVANAVAEQVGGTVEVVTDYERRVTGPDAGDWLVELDYEFLKRRARERADAGDEAAAWERTAEALLAAGSETIVPVEVVSPPLPIAELGQVQELIARLRADGAQGTAASFSHACGMQLNPEMPATDVDTVLAYLRAYACLHDWLEMRCRPDLTRRLTRFATPFPKDYVRRIIAPDHRPQLAGAIDDYLAWNPTRNRALDVLPLLLELDEPRVRAVVDDPRVKGRPALHYRLPNCEIDRESWGIHVAWADWLQVEALVAEPDRLRELCARYSDWLDAPLERLTTSWAEEVKPWLADEPGR